MFFPYDEGTPFSPNEGEPCRSNMKLDDDDDDDNNNNNNK
jgi:hypothetical protein